MMDRRARRPSQPSRVPLGDATDRVLKANNSVQAKGKQAQPRIVDLNKPTPASPVSCRSRRNAATQKTGASTTKMPAGDDDDSGKRESQVSASTATSGPRRKTHIGPWHLGKTLGKGSAGRVRLARHSMNPELLVAVKILPKFPTKMTQSGSLNAVDAWDRSQPEFLAQNRMPLAIEREIAILKLIDHKNIMKLHDIWESRSEIYLVLEYVENGDLFGYISECGPLREDETLLYFRQIVSALEYCHAFNICHRDLKPENILLSKDRQIKIADFGMAAIQQTPSHKLKTPCGSPHYAAPELVSNKNGYRGTKADIWSLGVIVYACVCARLPFDVENTELQMSELLAKAATGVYDEPRWLSWGMKDLIRQMLTVDPHRRISVQQIWYHPMVVAYDHLDDLSEMALTETLGGIQRNGRRTPVDLQDLDMQTLRQLKSMYHMFTEKDLIKRLVNAEQNDQKLYYWLLLDYREKQLENYGADLTHSPSDFHHLPPRNWKKKYSTLEFPGEDGRSASRFTVISNVPDEDHAFETATDGGGTVQSYDPYHSSRIMGENEASRARITVYRNGSNAKSSIRAAKSSRRHNGSIRMMKSSSTYSRYTHGIAPIGDGTPGKRRPSSRSKRGVDFSHIRNSSRSSYGPTSIAGDEGRFTRDHASLESPMTRSRPSQNSGRDRDGIQSMLDVSIEKEQKSWNDDLDEFSHGIALDCDEAFNSSLILPESPYLDGDASIEPSAMLSGNLDHSLDAKSLSMKMDTPSPIAPVEDMAYRDSRRRGERPLPPRPEFTHGVLDEAVLAKKRAELRRKTSGQSLRHGDKVIPSPKRVMTPMIPNDGSGDRRAVSAPIYSEYRTQWGKNTIPLPSINETRGEGSFVEQQRNVSAPVGGRHAQLSSRRRDLAYLSQQEKTVRMVISPSQQPSSVKIPNVQQVHKKLSRGSTSSNPESRQEPTLRQQYIRHEIGETIPEEPSNLSQRVSSEVNKKKSSWFKRSSKDDSDPKEVPGSSGTNVGNSTPSLPPSSPRKKKSLNFAFWRNSKGHEDVKISLADRPTRDVSTPRPSSTLDHQGQSTDPQWIDSNVSTRNIEPQQNWLARLFRVKPATTSLCFSVSDRRARQEIVILLKEWRYYGIKDLEVDKARNIVFGRLDADNHHGAKEVSFAAESLAMIEHGSRRPLSIVRFTQERGAASSFHKIVDTIAGIFQNRNLLVADKQKVKMMLKTLESATTPQSQARPS